MLMGSLLEAPMSTISFTLIK